MAVWEGDAELSRLARQIEEDFLQLPSDDWINTGKFNWSPWDSHPQDEAGRPVAEDVDPFLGLRPDAIQPQVEALEDAVRRLVTGESGIVIRAQILGRLNAGVWTGAAADAFRTQAESLELFRDSQVYQLQRLQKLLGAIYAVGVEARTSYATFATATSAAIAEYREKQEAARTELDVGILGAVATAALAAPVTGLVSAVVAGATAVAGEVIKTEAKAVAGGDSLHALAENYRMSHQAMVTRLYEHYDDLMSGLNEAIRDITGDPPRLFEPLPVSVDVHSPDFRWEHFASRADPGGAPGRVPGAIAQHETGEQNPDGPIQQALG